MPNFQFWDIKYYYRVHCAKQRQRGNHPVSYPAFSARLKKMNLHDAIYTPRCEYNVRHRDLETPIQNEIRRRQINKEENIHILDLNQIDAVLTHGRQHKVYAQQFQPMIPKPKKSLWRKFISLFK